MPLSLDPILPHVPAWVLVLFRLTGLFLFAPLFGSVIIPARFKVLLALILSLCVYPALLDANAPARQNITPVIDQGLTLWGLAAAVTSELLIGLILGFGASLPITAMQLGGHMIDQQIGLGLAGIINPELDEQSGVVGEFYFMLALVLFLIAGGHRILLATLIESFHHVPLAGFVPDGGLALLMVGLITAMFELAIRVCAPLLCLVFLETVAIGFIARTVPQLNILSVGFPLRILAGTALVAFSVAVVAGAYNDVMRRTLSIIGSYFMR